MVKTVPLPLQDLLELRDVLLFPTRVRGRAASVGRRVRLGVGVAARAKIKLDLFNLLLESRIVLTLDVGAGRGLAHRV